MLTGIHVLLSYACNFECDHCFLYCSPSSGGTFTIEQITAVLDDASKIGTVKWIYYEGGEPFLFFPLLVESVRQARARGFKVGIVTNAYGANSAADAELWLSPLVDSGVNFLSISNDAFHYGEAARNPATIAASAAKRLGLETAPICIDPPKTGKPGTGNGERGTPVVGGDVKFRGRAADKLTKGLPLRPINTFVECPYEDLEKPSRVHIDVYGNVHVCQGLSIGNMWKAPLSNIIQTYRPEAHPVCGPLLRGGPAALVQALDIEPASVYVDECHCCYLTRKAVLDRFPGALAPRQVYGLP
jgi:hypothetical protein